MADDGEVVHHEVPYGIVRRLLIGAFGVFVVGSAVIFPSSWHSNPIMDIAFLIIRLVIGVVIVHVALTASAQRWTVRRGLVSIEARGLFSTFQQEFGPNDVKEFDLQQGNDEESATWAVVLRTRAGKSLATRSLVNEQDAIKLFLDMRRVFYGDTLPRFYGPHVADSRRQLSV